MPLALRRKDSSGLCFSQLPALFATYCGRGFSGSVLSDMLLVAIVSLTKGASWPLGTADLHNVVSGIPTNWCRARMHHPGCNAQDLVFDGERQRFAISRDCGGWTCSSSIQWNCTTFQPHPVQTMAQSSVVHCWSAIQQHGCRYWYVCITAAYHINVSIYSL